MSRIVEELKKTGVFYVATVEDGQPRLRPFGAVMDYQGGIYFCTNNQKNVYRQLCANPNVEICGMLPDGAWVRVTGQLVREDSDAARAAMLEEVPPLKNMYRCGDGLFEVLRLERSTALLYAPGAAPTAIEG